MRIYYDRRGQVRGYSTGLGGYYANEAVQWYKAFFVVGLLILAAAAIVAAVAAFFLICGVLWFIGWTMARTGIGGEKGPRLQSGVKNLFTSSRRGPPQVGKRASSARANVTPPANPRPGPRDPWLNEVAVALADLDLTEYVRNTGETLGDAPLEADIWLKRDKFSVSINLFGSSDLVHQAELGLRAKPAVREAISQGHTVHKTAGRLLFVADGLGRVVDEISLDEVALVVGKLALPPPLETTLPSAGMGVSAPPVHSNTETPTRLEFPTRITQRWIIENVPAMRTVQIPTLIAELQRRGWTDDTIEQRVSPYLRGQRQQTTTPSSDGLRRDALQGAYGAAGAVPSAAEERRTFQLMHCPECETNYRFSASVPAHCPNCGAAFGGRTQ